MREGFNDWRRSYAVSVPGNFQDNVPGLGRFHVLLYVAEHYSRGAFWIGVEEVELDTRMQHGAEFVGNRRSQVA